MYFEINLIKAIGFAILTITNCQLTPSQVIEAKLVKTLFTNYSKNIRPNDVVDVAVGIQLKQIVGLVEKTQVLTTSIYLEQWWNDARLSWNPAKYNDTSVLLVLLKNIWTPDTNIINSASGDGYLTINADFGYVSVLYTGDVYYISPAISMSTRCSLNVQSFPFDSQTCSLKITSWNYGDSRVKFSVNDSYVDLSDYTQNLVWSLVSTNVTSASTIDRSSTFETDTNTVVYLNLYITRNGLFYMMNSVFPCFILNIVILLLFFAPIANGLTLGLF